MLFTALRNLCVMFLCFMFLALCLNSIPAVGQNAEADQGPSYEETRK